MECSSVLELLKRAVTVGSSSELLLAVNHRTERARERESGVMNSLQWITAAVLAVSAGVSYGITAVCPVNKLQFLSYNETLLPRSSINASSENADMQNPIDHFILKGAEPWCSDYGGVFSQNLHINMTFTEPVVITFLQSTGYYNSFVDKFTIHYALGKEAGIFMPYGVLQTLQVFTVTHDNGKLFDDAYFSLERQLVAERLRFDIQHSISDASNRSCWTLYILGCTFREAMIIEEADSGNEDPCLISSNGGMVMMNTANPEPTPPPIHPAGPCVEQVINDARSSVADERVVTIVIPVAVGAVVVCAVIVGIGIISCYIIVARKPQQIGKKYQEGVNAKVLGHKAVAVPTELGNEQKAFVANGTMLSQKDSICSDTDSFHYDMPRPTMYDVPRTPPQRQRAGTISSTNEYRNPIYDGASSKESNTYESIPYDLERTGRTRAASENLSKAETRVRRASDMLPRPQTEENEQEGLSQAMRGSDPQIVQYSIVDKSRKNKEPVPVFEALYDQTSKDDIDTPITS